MKKIFSTITKIIYGTVVLLVVALAMLFIGTKIDFFGYEVRVVKSGSMEPAIDTGAIVIISPRSAYGVGDVVTYEAATRSSLPVTHRIVEVDDSQRVNYYLTKGDANEDLDPNPVAHPQVIGKVVHNIPYLGYAIEFARTPLGFALLIGIPAAVIVLDEFANIVWEFHKYRHAKRRTRSGKVSSRTLARQRQSCGKTMAPAKVGQGQGVFTPRSVLDKEKVSAKKVTVDSQRYELNQRSV